MALDLSWIERIHARMLVRYGAAWVNLWKGIDPEAVKQDWAQELSGMPRDALRYALENLPERPPTVAQFKASCLNRPRYAEVPVLPAAPANPEKVREALEAMGKLKHREGNHDWAHALQEREKAGERLTEAQRVMWRNSVDTQPEATAMMQYKPIDPAVLPPGMRA